MEFKRPQLKQTLGRVEIFALTFGTMVGWGSFVLPIQWISSGGVLGTVISLIITTLMCLCVGLTYAELTSTFPVAGGEIAFTYRYMGINGAWFTGWIISLAYLSVAAWEGIAISSAINYLIPIPKWGYLWTLGGYEVYFSWIMIGVVGIITLTIINIVGVRKVAAFQIILVLMIIIAGIIYIMGAIGFGTIQNNEPLITDTGGISSVLIMIPSMFIGFDLISKSAEEVNIPLRNVAKVLIFSICATALWYILVTVSTFFLSSADNGYTEAVTIADIAQSSFHSTIIGKLIIIGAICGIITSWNGFIMCTSRIFFSMGRAKMLPGIFSFVHPKYGTPIFSIVFVGVICCLFAFIGENAFSWLVNVAAFGTVVSYLMISISYLLIKKNEPGIKQGFTLRHGYVIGICAVICSTFFLFWFTPLSNTGLSWTYEWFIIILWAILGIILFIFIKITEHKKNITPQKREILIYGESHSREMPR